MIAIKNWFLQKNNLNWLRNYTLEIVKETQKAILVRITDKTVTLCMEQHWIPKSVVIDEWEKDTSGFAYHRYLEDVYHDAYDRQLIENRTINSGRNTYRGDDFIHQLTTKDLVKVLEKHNIKFMDRNAWNNR